MSAPSEFDNARVAGVEITDAILIKQAHHENEPIITLDRQGIMECVNCIILGNSFPAIDTRVLAMNILRDHIVANSEKYDKVVAEFAGQEKVFEGIVDVDNREGYGMKIRDIIIFQKSAYDSRLPLRAVHTKDARIENCAILTASRIEEMPTSCKLAITYLQDHYRQVS